MLWSFFFFLWFFFLAAQSLYEIPRGWASWKRFCSLKALKSIQELTNCTVKGWLMVMVMWIHKNWVHCTTEFKWISIACSKRILFEAFCCFEKKKTEKDKKTSNFAVRLVLRPKLSYLTVFKPWVVYCNVIALVSLCHNVIVFFLLCFVCLFILRVGGNHWRISDFHLLCCYL